VGKFRLFLWHPIEEHEHDDPGNPDAKGDGVNAFRMGVLEGEVVPLFEIIGLEGAVGRIEDHFGIAFEEQSERPPGCANVDRLPEPVENQNLLVQETIHSACRAKLRRNVAQGPRGCQLRKERKPRFYNVFWRFLGEQLLHDITVDICQPVAAALIFEGQFFVIDPEGVQKRSL